jgi:alanine racemase
MASTGTYIRAELSAGAIARNIALCRNAVGPGVRIAMLAKANAYGHGLRQVLPVLAAHADGCIVASPAEALDVRALGYTGPLLMLFSCGEADWPGGHADTIADLVRGGVTLTVTSTAEADLAAWAAQRTGRRAAVHVMLDSGMTRSGILPAGAPALLTHIRGCPALILTGIYTHLASADESDKSFAHRQLDTFDAALRACAVGPEPGLVRHAANSAALLDIPRSRYDMVRLGLSAYGYRPAPALLNPPALQPALRVTSLLMQTKRVPAGTACGYGCSHVCRRDSLVGLVPIGYGDGYLRDFSNRACMLVGGRPAPVIGRVSMDQTIVDLTDVPGAQAGDPVLVISDNPADPNSVENLAAAAGTIPYVVTTHLAGPRLHRVLGP